MKSETINTWNRLVKNAPNCLKEYFVEEEKFLKNNIFKKDVVLDIGCGTGRTILIISPISKKIIGIDNDRNAFEEGKNNIKTLDNAEIYLEDAEEMHFEDKTFDIVFIGLSFVNFGESKFKILKGIKRILKDSGKLIFSVYNEEALEERLNMYKREDKNLKVDKEGKVTFSFGQETISEQFSKEEISKILINNSFKISKIIKGGIFYLIKSKK